MYELYVSFVEFLHCSSSNVFFDVVLHEIKLEMHTNSICFSLIQTQFDNKTWFYRLSMTKYVDNMISKWCFFILFFKTSRNFCSNHQKYNSVYDQKKYQCMRFVTVIYSKHSIRLLKNTMTRNWNMNTNKIKTFDWSIKRNVSKSIIIKNICAIKLYLFLYVISIILHAMQWQSFTFVQ